MAATVSMKLLIDNSTKSRRVIFAEASKDYVDFLFHILSLPVATTIRLLQEEGMVASLPNLYKSLESLDCTYIQPERDKNTYLKPAAPVSSSSAQLLVHRLRRNFTGVVLVLVVLLKASLERKDVLTHVSASWSLKTCRCMGGDCWLIMSSY